MRRLGIKLVGTSPALHELKQALAPYGHELAAQAPAIDLLIEDGSQPLAQDLADIAVMSLRLSIGPMSDWGLPALQIRCYDRVQQLLAVLDVLPPSCGNGQQLRRQAVARLVEWAALQVCGFSRNPGHFTRRASASTFPEQSLQGLEGLAYLHRLNRTDDPVLLQKAEIPLIKQLEHSLRVFADRPALEIAGLTLSYRQLLRHSLAIAQVLRPLLGPGQAPVVGICLDKSVGLYASILATLGCNAVYLPLEPGHPLPRQQAMLENAAAVVLLDDGQHPLRGHFVTLDVSRIDCQHMDDSLPLALTSPSADNASMVLYTSGTTGQPKGVLLSQHNLAHFCAWYRQYAELTEHSRVLQFSSLSFDSSLVDLFPALCQGATLIVPSEEQRRDPCQLVELIQQRRVSHAFLPPALLSLLPMDQPLGLEHLLTGGDICEPHVIAQMAGQCALHNLYGPTEATVLVSSRRMRADDSNLNLGIPIANSQVLILDEQRCPVEDQVVGELYIVGPGVSLGYVNQPRQTAEHFVHLVLPDGQTLRAYRTGDMGKWTAEGIELAGRQDQQVKIRGFRVEPQEIEQCLRASQMFRQVAVVVDRDRRVLAFVAHADPGYPGSALAALKQHARQMLPDYMQPTVCTELMSLPYGSNGKVDRQALLTLAVQAVSGNAQCRPQTPVEVQLLSLWSELLGLPVDEISTDDSFFHLGGHSILLSTMLLRIRELYGRSLPLNRFIEAPTVQTLAALMGDSVSGAAPADRAISDALRTLDITLLPAERVGNRHKAIVTGANSFLGIHIVEALLVAGATEVACLVRESPGLSATERFAEALREYHLEHLDLSRVRVYAADLRQPRLGLEVQAYEHIARQYGVLVHSAAHVNHVMDYASLAKDNVEPVLECLRLCETHCKKVLNFVSTLSASSSVGADGQVLEAPAASTPPLYIKNGYNLSKWVAERLLGRAAGQGAWVNIYRPGNISFNSRNGVCQPHKNRLMLMLKGSLQLGRVPRLDLNFDLMPVDFLARFIAFHSANCVAGRSVFNLHNPQPLRWETYVESFRQAGHAFELVSVEDWQHHLREVGHENALFGVLGFYLNELGEDIGDISMIRHENARHGVEQMGAQYPEKAPELLRRGCQYLNAIGFL
ncbi:non-ribosomal peptide synthetase MgoA [Pseudomonas fluorescens]|uniref:Non-ribosomal peptide synthetase MgoA n=1 Tax=Pseudomonas fluorescens TaxID=294 RepID=A0A379I5C1_PSEFL|nr:amino acid adenylation domain-containing protein [Pseudomonas fluorescens]AIG04061.1 peptide transporter [Pseudomonas fluorescens]SUD27211.1 non-ribosomal peptide synthetase MgoA [Pseudomonas fluorescens]